MVKQDGYDMNLYSRNILFEFYRFPIPVAYCAIEPNSYYTKKSMTIKFEVQTGVLLRVKGVAINNYT